MNQERKTWLFTAYNDKGKEIPKLNTMFEGRTEQEAHSEGLKYSEQFSQIDDWSITPREKL